MSTGGRKGREAKMYIVEFIFFGDSRLFREILTSVDEVEQFLRGFDELEQKLIYINYIMKEAEFTKDEFLQMNSAADRRVYFVCPFDSKNSILF